MYVPGTCGHELFIFCIAAVIFAAHIFQMSAVALLQVHYWPGTVSDVKGIFNSPTV